MLGKLGERTKDTGHMMELDLGSPADGSLGISPQREMGAYEALWDEDGATFKTISEKLSKRPDTIPSDLVEPKRVEKYREAVRDVMAKANVERFGIRVLGAGEYPNKLRDADYPIAVLYYRGWWDLVNSRSVAVVGTRTPSEDGIKRARMLVRELVKDGFTIRPAKALASARPINSCLILRSLSIVGADRNGSIKNVQFEKLGGPLPARSKALGLQVSRWFRFRHRRKRTTPCMTIGCCGCYGRFRQCSHSIYVNS
jgi:hypothetical protein